MTTVVRHYPQTYNLTSWFDLTRYETQIKPLCGRKTITQVQRRRSARQQFVNVGRPHVSPKKVIMELGRPDPSCLINGIGHKVG